MDRGWDRADRMEGIFLLFSRLFSRFFFRREGIGFEENLLLENVLLLNY